MRILIAVELISKRVESYKLQDTRKSNKAGVGSQVSGKSREQKLAA